MKAILKTANRFKWYDPIIDSPVPRNREERRLQAAHLAGHAAGGAFLGVGLGVLHDAAKAKKGGTTLGKTFDPAKALMLMSSGAAAGGSLGLYSGGYQTLRRRQNMGQPLYTPEEEAKKLELAREAGPPVYIKTG